MASVFLNRKAGGSVRLALLSIVMMISAVVVIGLPHGGSQAAWPGANGKIVYQASASNGIWVMDSDGSNREQLTSDPSDRRPSWSPDGMSIVFVRTPEQSGSSGGQGGVAYDIWTMDADGRNQQRVGPGENPSWSPDGTRILYELSARIHEMDADGGGNDVMITNEAGVYDAAPVYRPDGTKIAFVRGYQSGPMFVIDLVVSDPDGDNVELIKSGDSITQWPDWFPDGSGLLFFNQDGILTTPYPNPDPQIIYPWDGDIQLRDPTFSPDMSTIMFVRGAQTGGASEAGGAARVGPSGSYDYKVWTMEPDGSNPQPIANDEPGAAFAPDWQPVLGPTPSPAPQQTELWGDNNCDGAVEGGDVSRGLLALAAADSVAEVADCPDMGESLQFVDVHPAGSGTIVWGDLYCGGGLDGRDVLALLFGIGGLEPLVPVGGFCPKVGDEVVFYRQ